MTRPTDRTITRILSIVLVSLALAAVPALGRPVHRGAEPTCATHTGEE